MGIEPSLGVAVRLSDKFSRFYSLLRKPENEQVNESIYDLMDDIAVYAGIYLLLRKEEDADFCHHDGVEDASDCPRAPFEDRLEHAYRRKWEAEITKRHGAP